eukprot:6271094-Prymnesium_polylepis.2
MTPAQGICVQAQERSSVCNRIRNERCRWLGMGASGVFGTWQCGPRVSFAFAAGEDLATDWVC